EGVVHLKNVGGIGLGESVLGAIANLAREIGPPAEDIVIRHACAGMSLARRELDDMVEMANDGGLGRARRLARDAAAELARIVVSPTGNVAVFEACAGVIEARRDFD